MEEGPAVRTLPRQRYKTNQRHGDWPAGADTWVSRTEKHLVLEYDDGTVVKLPGDQVYANGLEPPILPPPSFADSLREEIYEVEDARSFAVLDSYTRHLPGA